MRILLTCLTLVAGSALLTSCSITQGSVVPTTHYVYPNSNVTPLGYTSGQVKKFGILLPPRFRAKDLDKLYGQAMNKYQGTDLIIDSKVDSRNTSLIIFTFMKVTISGTAAKMEVGKQDIGQPGFSRDNNQPAVVQQQVADNTPVNQSQQQSVNQPVQREIIPEQPRERKPKKGFRVGAQAVYVKRDILKPAFGLTTEFFLSPKVSLSPGVNMFTSQRLDVGYGLGTFDAQQTAVWIDQHYYFVNKQIGFYGLTSASLEFSKFENFETPANLDPVTEIGLGAGLGLCAEFLNGHLVPFVELRYVGLQPLNGEAYEMNRYLSTNHNGRLSWGIRYSFKGKQ